MEQVVRCCLENAASVAKTFLTADAVNVYIDEPAPKRMREPMPTSGNITLPQKKRTNSNSDSRAVPNRVLDFRLLTSLGLIYQL